MQTEKPFVIKEFSHKKIFTIVGILLFIIALIPSFFFYTKYRQAQKMLAEKSSSTNKEEVRSLVEKAGKLILLPVGEEPTVITVTDINQVKNQPFFTNAKNGDKVLVYNQAKKAILYDPAANKIIEVGPLIIPSPSPAVSATLSAPPSIILSTTPIATTSSTLKVFLYNGTSTVGLTGKIETLLKGKLNNVEIVDRDNAQKKDYEKTLVIDLTGKKSEQVNLLAKTVTAEVSSLPAGENKPPDSDFLIIVGADKK
ncbi:hypothetical protein MUP32_01435 [Candidatus Microgenomates bacterium]|nr:hypothetical protein [Candidatus Microgenomates bacterium]